MDNLKTVSFDNEQLVLVDINDNIVGHNSKKRAHHGEGILHRAFSLFIFNSQRELLIQKRSSQKLLWHDYWSNSVCSHPRKSENLEEAVHRRLLEELGIDTQLIFIYKFIYNAKFKDIGSENELCYVYFGKSDDKILANPNEISEWKFVSLDKLSEDISHNPNYYTPWFKIELKRIQTSYKAQLDSLFG